MTTGSTFSSTAWCHRQAAFKVDHAVSEREPWTDVVCYVQKTCLLPCACTTVVSLISVTCLLSDSASEIIAAKWSELCCIPICIVVTSKLFCFVQLVLNLHMGVGLDLSHGEASEQSLFFLDLATSLWQCDSLKRRVYIHFI